MAIASENSQAGTVGQNAPNAPAPEVNPADRRASPRINLNAEVTFSGHDNFYTGFAEDVSEGGLFVNTYDIKPIGTEFDLKFSLPSGEEVEATAIVRWVREPRDPNSEVPPGMGLQFLALSDINKAAIERFLKQREPLFYDE